VDLFLDEMLSDLDAECKPQVTEDDLHAGVDVKTTLPTSGEPIKAMSGKGIKCNGKEDRRVN